MNLGIIIAVSDYGSLKNNLPGCIVDGKAISTILKQDSKFDDILVITSNTNSSDVKKELITFISNHKKNEIEDVVFYFTGHGDFDGDEFYYLLSDYDRKRRKQTSLENTELDNLLKTLNPKNTIKIVDACHSGTPYIKDSEAFGNYLKETKGEFKKCYFMFSSQTDQLSYQDAHLSFFTKSIVESIYNHSGGIIRYKDIIDYVSDSFADSASQTPFFIVQADFTEPFTTVSTLLKSSLSSILGGDTSSQPSIADNEKKKKTLLERVQDDAARFCTEDEAKNFINEFISIIKITSLDKKLDGLYDITYEEINDISTIPSVALIGKWLDSNDHKFFAQSISEHQIVNKKVLKDSRRERSRIMELKKMINNEYNDDDYEWKQVSERFVKGFRSTVDFPIKLLKINLEAKFLNIASAVAFIVPIISRIEMRVFFSFNFYEESGWGEKQISTSAKWLTEVVGLKNRESHLELSQNIINQFSDFIYTPLAEQFQQTDKIDEEVKEQIEQVEIE